MKGGARIATSQGAGGRTRLTALEAAAPLAVKRTGPGEVHLVGSAAGPLDGDDVLIEIDVQAGTTLTVRTVAATLAWPSRRSGVSRMNVRARVGAGATLRWLPEQLVPVRGCSHELRCSVDVAPGGSLLWREEIVLGRLNEQSGRLDAETRVTLGGAPVLHQRLVIDAGLHSSPAILGRARATGTLLVLDPTGPPDAPVPAPDAGDGVRGAILALEGGGRLATATAASASALRAWLETAEDVFGAAVVVTDEPELRIPEAAAR